MSVEEQGLQQGEERRRCASARITHGRISIGQSQASVTAQHTLMTSTPHLEEHVEDLAHHEEGGNPDNHGRGPVNHADLRAGAFEYSVFTLAFVSRRENSFLRIATVHYIERKQYRNIPHGTIIPQTESLLHLSPVVGLFQLLVTVI